MSQKSKNEIEKDKNNNSLNSYDEYFIVTINFI